MGLPYQVEETLGNSRMNEFQFQNNLQIDTRNSEVKQCILQEGGNHKSRRNTGNNRYHFSPPDQEVCNLTMQVHPQGDDCLSYLPSVHKCIQEKNTEEYWTDRGNPIEQDFHYPMLGTSKIGNYPSFSVPDDSYIHTASLINMQQSVGSFDNECFGLPRSYQDPNTRVEREIQPPILGGASLDKRYPSFAPNIRESVQEILDDNSYIYTANYDGCSNDISRSVQQFHKPSETNMETMPFEDNLCVQNSDRYYIHESFKITTEKTKYPHNYSRLEKYNTFQLSETRSLTLEEDSCNDTEETRRTQSDVNEIRSSVSRENIGRRFQGFSMTEIEIVDKNERPQQIGSEHEGSSSAEASTKFRIKTDCDKAIIKVSSSCEDILKETQDSDLNVKLTKELNESKVVNGTYAETTSMDNASPCDQIANESFEKEQRTVFNAKDESATNRRYSTDCVPQHFKWEADVELSSVV